MHTPVDSSRMMIMRAWDTMTRHRRCFGDTSTFSHSTSVGSGARDTLSRYAPSLNRSGTGWK
jgi:hypothetical protein